MISARHPTEALVHLGQLQLSHLHPQPTMTPEFLAPPPRPYPRYPPRRRDAMPAPAPYSPVPGAYSHFLPQHNFPYLYRRAPPSFPLRPRPTSGFVPPPPAPHSPRTPPLPVSQVASAQHVSPREEAPVSPERGAPAPYFCRGALIRLEDGTYRRVEEMRTEDFTMSAENNEDVVLTQCTLLRLDDRGDRIALILAYDRNRSQVELESTAEHPFFVYGRGWASYMPERTMARYGLHVQKLQVGDVCVTLVARKHTTPTSVSCSIGAAPPQTQPENLSVKEDVRKRRWSVTDIHDDGPPLKKR